ncbi:Glycosyltransferase-like 1B [Mortierella alpina]|nr:Glycosyltransferase-like 1B [Mortierella alpina]
MHSMDRSLDHSMDWFKRRRLRPSIRRKLRRIRTSFRLHTRRNVLILLISTFLILHIISRIGRHRNSVEQRWQRLQEFAHPGIFGAPPDLVLNGPEDVLVQLCNVDGRLCSSWNHDRLWEDDELNRDESWLKPGTIRVPIGVQATLTMKNGQQRILRYGHHKCDPSTLDCHGIQRMAVQESIMSAIEKIAETCSGNDWIKEPAIIHTIHPKRTFSKRDVSMIAQFSISRLERFEHARRVWPGPISVVIFLATNSDIITLKKYFEQPDKMALYETITLTIVKPDYSQGTHKRYPINSLRNIGIRAASSDYIYMIDADFVPTTSLYAFATTNIIPLLERATTPTAYVVPCLAIKDEYQGQYPDTIEELQPLMKSGMAYITDPRAGHGPTSTSLFMHTPVFGHSPAFEVCFESQWEPYYIVNRNAPHPYYDERFKNQGGDKQSHALLMNAIGYRFMVLRDHFMYHMDHPKLKWTGDGLDQHTQRDFTYFADYLPALEKIFGGNFRWPWGCSRPLVHSSRWSLEGNL